MSDNISYDLGFKDGAVRGYALAKADMESGKLKITTRTNSLIPKGWEITMDNPITGDIRIDTPDNTHCIIGTEYVSNIPHHPISILYLLCLTLLGYDNSGVRAQLKSVNPNA